MTPSRGPAVSVIVPTHSQRKHLALALASVRAQTFRDFEIVVVDDASTDGTRAWLRTRRWPELRSFRLPVRKGTPGARNAAVAEARGRLLAFLDHDDLWAPSYLKEMVEAFRDPKIMMAAANVDMVDARGDLVLRKAIGSSGRIDRVLRAVSGLSHTPCMSACVFRRRALVELGGFDEGFETLDDLDLFYRVADRYGPRAIVFLDRVLASYRLHPGQQTAVYRNNRTTPGILKALLKGGKPDPRERACLMDTAYFYAKHAKRLLRVPV
jgi:glycosyltransferase involved in cell wall biosynthesis